MAKILLREYSKRLGKNPVVAAQRAARGSFETAEKFGRDWWIDEDEPWLDARIKTGKYIDFRSKLGKKK